MTGDLRRPRRGHPRADLALVLLAAALAGGACLPTTLRPPPSPTPSPAPGPTAVPTASPTPGPPTPTPAPTFTPYTVKRGDTLTSIAKALGTTPRSIAYWNREAYPGLDPESGGYDPNRLQVGWVLRILPGQERETPMDEGEAPDESPPPWLNPDPDEGEPVEEPSAEASMEPGG